MKRLKEFWCELMHASVMWPIDGHYECRTCGRRFEVPWILKSEDASSPDPKMSTATNWLQPVTRG